MSNKIKELEKSVDGLELDQLEKVTGGTTSDEEEKHHETISLECKKGWYCKNIEITHKR